MAHNGRVISALLVLAGLAGGVPVAEAQTQFWPVNLLTRFELDAGTRSNGANPACYLGANNSTGNLDNCDVVGPFDFSTTPLTPAENPHTDGVPQVDPVGFGAGSFSSDIDGDGDTETLYGSGTLASGGTLVPFGVVANTDGATANNTPCGAAGEGVPDRPFIGTVAGQPDSGVVASSNAFGEPGNFAENPWPPIDPNDQTLQTKTEYCYVYSTVEVIKVPVISGGAPIPGAFQNHTLMYFGFDRNPSSQGSVGVTLLFFLPPDKDREQGDVVIDFSFATNPANTAFFLREWNVTGLDSNGNTEGDWVSTALDENAAVCAFSPDGRFIECAINLTNFEIVKDDECVITRLPGDTISRASGSSINNSLADIAAINNPTPLESCGELVINKVTEPPIAPGTGNDVEFGYEFFQKDGAVVYSAFTTPADPLVDLSVDGLRMSPGPAGVTPNDYLPTDAPVGTRAIVDRSQVDMPTTDTGDAYANVLGQPDYQLMEIWSRASTGGTAPPALPAALDPNWPVVTGDNPTSIVCTFTDVFDEFNPAGSFAAYAADPGNVAEPRHTATIATAGVLDTNAVFGVVSNAFLGVPITPTECTMNNFSALIPVTLSAFEARRGGGGVRFDWTVQTETSNLGYILYVQDGKGEDGKALWRQLDFVPAQPGDSLSPRTYSHVAKVGKGNSFAIADVAITGFVTMHGPFKLGKAHGVADAGLRKIDWSSIRLEHAAKKQAREQQRKQKLEQKMQKQSKSKKTSALQSFWSRTLAGALALLLPAAHAADLPADPGLMQIGVTESGVYRVTHEQLMAKGLDLGSADVSQIALTHRGVPVPIHVHVADGGDDDAGGNPITHRGSAAADDDAHAARAGRQDTLTQGRRPAADDDVHAASSRRSGGGSQSPFGPGSYIEFIGEALDDLHTGTNVYVLHLDASKAARAATASKRLRKGTTPTFYLETVRVEEEQYYSDAAPNGDPWYAREMLAWRGPHTTTVTIDVDGYVSGAADVTANVGLWGVTNLRIINDHHVVLSLNGSVFADELFDGLSDHPVTATTGALFNGTNTLTLHLPLDTGGAYDRVHLNDWSVTYPRHFRARDGRLHFRAAAPQFEVQGLPSDQIVVYRKLDSGAVEKIRGLYVESSGSEYRVRLAGQEQAADYHVVAEEAVLSAELAVSPAFEDLTSGTADYMVIAHGVFLQPPTAMNNLVGLRENWGHTVRVVNVDQVYAQFGHGIRGPQAIADYIAYAHANMGTEIVHLVGGETSDPRDYTGTGSISFIPTLYGRTHYTVLHAPLDSLYGDVDGNRIPEVAIGRTPARNYAEFAILVDKIYDYENGYFDHRSVFSADKLDVFANYDFKADADDMIARIPAVWRDNVQKIYLDDYLEADPANGAANARNDLTGAINYGIAVTSFAGHSSLYEWTWDALLTNSEARNLSNRDAPTLVTQWGCYNTYYVQPDENTLAHELLLNHSGGAAAVLGASGLTKGSHERLLALEVYERMFDGKPLGITVVEAKQALAASVGPAYLGMMDVIGGWQYLGDPGMRIQP